MTKVTVSAGISILKTEDLPSSIIDCVDQALYQSKNNGRNKVTILL
jgi:PleD family two-component response regulator